MSHSVDVALTWCLASDIIDGSEMTSPYLFFFLVLLPFQAGKPPCLTFKVLNVCCCGGGGMP